MMRIELLVTDGCVNQGPTGALLQEVVGALVPDVPVHRIIVQDEEQARVLAFVGSPSIRVDGVDLEGDPVGSVSGLTGRTYDGAGVPPRWLMEAALLRALAPRSYLFLCVANSARSQLAEGIARSLAPTGVTVASAGSDPSDLRPEAVAVLSELGLDLTGHRSKSVDELPRDSVDAVITLCAGEVCPTWLGQALRVHWGLPDPAAVTGPGRLDAFRATRDELRRRLARLLPPRRRSTRSSPR